MNKLTKVIVLCLFAAWLVCVSPIAAPQAKSPTAAENAVVSIQQINPADNSTRFIGSAFHIGNGRFLTSTTLTEGLLAKDILIRARDGRQVAANALLPVGNRITVVQADAANALNIDFVNVSAAGVAPQTQDGETDQVWVKWSNATSEISSTEPKLIYVDPVFMTLDTSLTYASIGAPVLNRCGHVVGVIQPMSEVGTDVRGKSALTNPVNLNRSVKATALEALKAGLNARNVEYVLGDTEVVVPSSGVQTCVTPHYAEWRRLVEAEAREREARAAKERAETEKARIEAEKSALVDATEAEIKAKQQELDEINRQLDAAQDELNEASKKVGILETTKKTLEDENITLEGENEKLSGDLTDRKKELSGLKGLNYAYMALSLLAIGLLGLLGFLIFKRLIARAEASEKELVRRAAILEKGLRGHRYFLDDDEGNKSAVEGVGLTDPAKGVVVGRSSNAASIIVLDEGVSRQHARFFVTEDGMFVEDLNSSNGTILNRQTLKPHVKTPVNDGDTIGFAGKFFVISTRKVDL